MFFIFILKVFKGGSRLYGYPKCFPHLAHHGGEDVHPIIGLYKGLPMVRPKFVKSRYVAIWTFGGNIDRTLGASSSLRWETESLGRGPASNAMDLLDVLALF